VKEAWLRRFQGTDQGWIIVVEAISVTRNQAHFLINFECERAVSIDLHFVNPLTDRKLPNRKRIIGSMKAKLAAAEPDHEDYRAPLFRSLSSARFGAGAASKRAQPLPSEIYSGVLDLRTHAIWTHRFAKRSVARRASIQCIGFGVSDRH